MDQLLGTQLLLGFEHLWKDLHEHKEYLLAKKKVFLFFSKCIMNHENLRHFTWTKEIRRLLVHAKYNLIFVAISSIGQWVIGHVLIKGTSAISEWNSTQPGKLGLLEKLQTRAVAWKGCTLLCLHNPWVWGFRVLHKHALVNFHSVSRNQTVWKMIFLTGELGARAVQEMSLPGVTMKWIERFCHACSRCSINTSNRAESQPELSSLPLLPPFFLFSHYDS